MVSGSMNYLISPVKKIKKDKTSFLIAYVGSDSIFCMWWDRLGIFKLCNNEYNCR